VRWSNVPIPEAHIAAIVAGAGMHALVPVHLPIGSTGRLTGAAMVAGGAGLAAWAVAAAGDADVERESELVTEGPYAITRNPMYLGWSAGVLGLALASRSAWMLIAWALAVRALDREVKAEESRLSSRFGLAYAAYRTRVPRYLPRFRRSPASGAGVALEKVPLAARTAWVALRDELSRILRDDLVAIWAYGGTIAVDDPAHVADLDTYVILARRPDDTTVQAIEAAQDEIAKSHGVEWDTWYVLADAARGADPPQHAWREERRDTSWAVNRAHWLAGRYALLHGPHAADVVKPPTWEELESELSRELEHIERHVVEGDTDPFEATYAILNGSRIIHSVQTRSVAISKRAAGAWAIEHLPARWHPALNAALRNYDGRPADGDVSVLAEEMAAFVEFVREHLPSAGERPADTLPRWSGY